MRGAAGDDISVRCKMCLLKVWHLMLSAFLASKSLATSRALLFVQRTTPSVFSVKRTFNRIAKCTELNQSRDHSSTSQPDDKITLDTIVDSLKKGEYRKVLVVAGAGVCVSAGIPDVSAFAGCFVV